MRASDSSYLIGLISSKEKIIKDINYYEYELLRSQDVGTYSHSPSAEDIAIHKMELEALMKAKEGLRSDERELIKALFFDGISKRTYMQKHGLTRKQLNTKLNDVYGKLREAVINI